MLWNLDPVLTASVCTHQLCALPSPGFRLDLQPFGLCAERTGWWERGRDNWATCPQALSHRMGVYSGGNSHFGQSGRAQQELLEGKKPS